MGLAFCTFSYNRLSVYRVLLIYLQYFRNILQTNVLLQKLGREITVIISDRAMVLALYTSDDDIQSMYQVVSNYLFYTFRDMLLTN